MTKLMSYTLVTLVAVLVRWCISLNGYSGRGKSPMFGDFEAQRHWMEITYNLPIKDWYQNTTENDLMYWGLDYPPLTAYHSWLCGYVADVVNPEWVTLNTSRGHESYNHKLFMRYTVLVADLVLYFPVVFLIFSGNGLSEEMELRGSLLMLMYPGLMLIDHGHFQYNSVSLGLTLLAVLLLGKGHELLGSASFVLALNYKQMELYHAFPFFFYLLGLCFKSTNQNGFLRLVKIGLTVLGTFAVCWFPFLTDKVSALQVLHRLFPFARGLYEDKVANVWCSLSVVLKLKNIFAHNQLVLLCSVTTVISCLPSCIDLLIKPCFKKFKYALINTSLAFFLFSFQVHEKSILIPAVIVSLYTIESPFWSLWFSIMSTFCMLPLLIKDGLIVPCIGTAVLYTILSFRCTDIFLDHLKDPSLYWQIALKKGYFTLSMIGVIILSACSLLVTPPIRLPDLFQVLISIYSCAHFLVFFVYFHVKQFTCSPVAEERISKRKKQN